MGDYPTAPRNNPSRAAPGATSPGTSRASDFQKLLGGSYDPDFSRRDAKYLFKQMMEKGTQSDFEKLLNKAGYDPDKKASGGGLSRYAAARTFGRRASHYIPAMSGFGRNLPVRALSAFINASLNEDPPVQDHSGDVDVPDYGWVKVFGDYVNPKTYDDGSPVYISPPFAAERQIWHGPHPIDGQAIAQALYPLPYASPRLLPRAWPHVIFFQPLRIDREKGSTYSSYYRLPLGNGLISEEAIQTALGEAPWVNAVAPHMNRPGVSTEPRTPPFGQGRRKANSPFIDPAFGVSRGFGRKPSHRRSPVIPLYRSHHDTDTRLGTPRRGVPPHVLKPPGPNETQKKQRPKNPYFWWFYRRMGDFTEGLDLLQSAYDALPEHRKSWRDLPQHRAWKVWKYYGEIDPNELLYNVAYNAFEDFIFGKIGSSVTNAAKPWYDLSGRPVGFQAGPAL